ncbi:MAG: hypothetical protein Q4D57_01815 [Clostridia bacterium]|nr:hypothetical protein [Clostridia bacterium]
MENKFFKILALVVIPLMLSGCRKSGYNDNNSIVSKDSSGSNKFSSVSPLESGKHYGKIGKLDGFWSVLEANVGKDTEAVLHIKFTSNSGKGKLVLVKPNSEVEVLAEVISGQDKEHFEGDVSAKCISGVNKIKIVGENYGGSFEIYQPNGVIFNNIHEAEVKYEK